ncbi:MAG: hypothetical protein LBI49_09345 [Nocardiopsaceae bacterium]|jgi:hypothetical protein|nr:hypothetical protein [Nocardiopsaceae bacterium]
MFKHIRAGRPALMAAAALTAALAFAVPASAASAQPTASAASSRPAAAAAVACHSNAALDRDEHTGALFAVGWTSCPVRFAADMRVNLWFDNHLVVGRTVACRLFTNCSTSSGSRLPLRGRHRYCAQSVFFISGGTGDIRWSCRYQ